MGYLHLEEEVKCTEQAYAVLKSSCWSLHLSKHWILQKHSKRSKMFLNSISESQKACTFPQLTEALTPQPFASHPNLSMYFTFIWTKLHRMHEPKDSSHCIGQFPWCSKNLSWRQLHMIVKSKWKVNLLLNFHLQEVEREISFRTECGLYYSYYKQMIQAASIQQGTVNCKVSFASCYQLTIFSIFSNIVENKEYHNCER